MLNKLLAKLNGHAIEPAALRETIAQIESNRVAARGAILELQIRRHQALLDDAADSVIERIERDIERQEVRLEKFDAAEPGLRAQLTQAEERVRREAEPRFVDEFESAFVDYTAALRALADAHRRQTEIRDRARLALGDGRAERLLPAFAYSGTPSHEHIAMWLDRNQAELRGAAEGRAGNVPAVRPTSTSTVRTPPTVRARLPHERAPATDSQREVRLGFSDAPARPVASTADDTAPLEGGNVRIVVLRAGYQNHLGQRCRAGWRGQMPRDMALQAARIGAIEIIEEPAVAAKPVVADSQEMNA